MIYVVFNSQKYSGTLRDKIIPPYSSQLKISVKLDAIPDADTYIRSVSYNSNSPNTVYGK